MNEVTAPFAPMFIRGNPSNLKNEVGEEMGQIYRQEEVVGWMYHFVQQSNIVHSGAIIERPAGERFP